ncbi:hypothetical protein I4U23_013990 [Adineta vaga]|nr:hypothetical protein I4U23_013990 [Adineta vaga]
MHKHSFLFSLTYNVLLVLICTMYAISTRKVPENFNETKFIGFTCYTTCIIWLAFLPIYFTADETGRHQVHITTLCVAISLCATVALFCLFSPKVYIILIHPEKNMRLANQLKAQASSFKFTSHIPMTTNVPLLDGTNNDVVLKSIVNNEADQLSPSSVASKSVSFKLIPNSAKTKPRLPSIGSTRDTNNCSNNDKQKLRFKKYTFDDDDSLNSNSNQGEDMML